MIRRIKFWLLKWLLDDICKRTETCRNCEFSGEEDSGGFTWTVCHEDYIFRQARKVWRIE